MRAKRRSAEIGRTTERLERLSPRLLDAPALEELLK
jgi:hypothetical protein